MFRCREQQASQKTSGISKKVGNFSPGIHQWQHFAAVFFVVSAVLVSLAVYADSQRPTIVNFQERLHYTAVDGSLT